jgi:hypothetical protein
MNNTKVASTHETEPVNTKPTAPILVCAERWQKDLIEILHGWKGPLFFYEADDVLEHVEACADCGQPAEGPLSACCGSDVGPGEFCEEYDTSAGTGNPQFVLSTHTLRADECAAIGRELLEGAGG